MSILSLFWTFFQFGLVSFGGGYVLVPLLIAEFVNRRGIISMDAFGNLVSIAQVTPGPVGLNAATYVGYQCGVQNIGGMFGGAIGGLVGTLGVMTPSLIIVTLIAYFIQVFKDNPIVKAVLSGIRPATLGLIAAAVIFFAETSVFTAPLRNLWTKGASFGICWQGVLIFALVLFVELKWKLNLIYVLIGSAILSYFLFLI